MCALPLLPMLLSVSEARQRLLASFAPLPVERVPLGCALRRVLAEPLVAPSEMPPFTNSSMDGFAVRARDTIDAGPDKPVRLAVVADIPAGRPSAVVVELGQAARIMTGAPVPAGADAVVPVEETDFASRAAGTPPPEWVKILHPARSGANVRPRGQDLHAGQQVLATGTRLRPQDVGMAAMLGFAEVGVFRQPRVGVLSTGDELLPVGASPQPGMIFESNAYTLGALVEDAGGVPLYLGIAPDEAEIVQARLDQAVAAQVDVILSSAGVSVGAFDFVRGVVEAHGSLAFWRVNMRPGKPLAFGSYRGIPYFGLPGNPVSSFVGFEVFVRAALYRLSGQEWQPPIRRARLAAPVYSDGRESYLRAVVSEGEAGLEAHLTGHQGSGNQFSLVEANALLVVPAGVDVLPAGADVEFWPL